MRNRPLSDLVTHPKPVTLPPEASAQEACRTMRARRIGCILVTDPTGRLGADCCDMAATPLGQVMTHYPQTLPPGATAMEALRLMQEGGFRHVPLVRDGVLAGIVSRWDFRTMEHARLNEETGFWEMLR
jgi:CBS domain-containing protein